MILLASVLISAPVSPRADETESMSAIDYLGDCIDDAVSFVHIENLQGSLRLSCGGAPARRFYQWLGRFVAERQSRLSDGLYNVREFGPNACGALLADESGKSPPSPTYRCELKLDVGGILGK